MGDFLMDADAELRLREYFDSIGPNAKLDELLPMRWKPPPGSNAPPLQEGTS